MKKLREKIRYSLLTIGLLAGSVCGIWYSSLSETDQLMTEVRIERTRTSQVLEQQRQIMEMQNSILMANRRLERLTRSADTQMKEFLKMGQHRIPSLRKGEVMEVSSNGLQPIEKNPDTARGGPKGRSRPKK